jgi:hypothetical protein
MIWHPEYIASRFISLLWKLLQTQSPSSLQIASCQPGSWLFFSDAFLAKKKKKNFQRVPLNGSHKSELKDNMARGLLKKVLVFLLQAFKRPYLQKPFSLSV